MNEAALPQSTVHIAHADPDGILLVIHARSRPQHQHAQRRCRNVSNAGTVRHLGVVLESLGKIAPDNAEGGIELANSDTCERIARLAQSLLDR